MKNSENKKKFSDQEIDDLLRKSLEELPGQVEEQVKAAAEKEDGVQELFDETRKQLLKEKLDLEIQRRGLEEEKLRLEMEQLRLEKNGRRNRRLKTALAAAAVLVLVVLIPLPAQGGRNLVDLLREGLSDNPNTHLDDLNQTVTEDDAEIIRDEEEIWKQVQEQLHASRLRFPGENTAEWMFEKGEVLNKNNYVQMIYKFRGEMINITICKNSTEENKPGVASERAEKELFELQDDPRTEAVIYVENKNQEQPISHADITCGTVLYQIESGMDFESFRAFIKELQIE